MPEVNEAYAASFRFPATGTQSTPAAQRGLTPPPNWGTGLKNSKFEWNALNPNGSGWSSQTTDPLIVGASNPKSGQYRANGNPFTINIIGSPQNAAITNLIAQVSCFTTSDDTPNGIPTYIDPPLDGYLWNGVYSSNTSLLTVPARGDASMVTFTQPAAQAISLTLGAGNDGNGGALWLCPAISFVFKPNLRGLVASRGKIFMDLAIYLSLGGTNCFDDPEMEIDLGS
jgi:hypothetical protein